jgi:hypothetical protein
MKYFVMAVTKQNYICRDIKSKLNSGNACYHLQRIFCLLHLLFTDRRIGRELVLSVQENERALLHAQQDALTQYKDGGCLRMLLRVMFGPMGE